MFHGRSQFRHDPRPCRPGAASATSAAPGSTSSLRTANRHRVLDVLRDDAGVFTQAELARATGLAPATVSSLVRELSEEGLVEAEPGSGRRGSAVRLSRDDRHRGRHRLRAHPPRRGRRRPLRTHPRRSTAVDWRTELDHHQMLADARTMLDRRRGSGTARLRAVGLGLPAPVTGDVIQSSAHLPGLGGRQRPRGRRGRLRSPRPRRERRQPRRPGRAPHRRRARARQQRLREDLLGRGRRDHRRQRAVPRRQRDRRRDRPPDPRRPRSALSVRQARLSRGLHLHAVRHQGGGRPGPRRRRHRPGRRRGARGQRGRAARARGGRVCTSAGAWPASST